MSNTPTSWDDPYQTPQTVPVAVAAGPLPTGLKAVCIIAIVLGALGMVLSCFGAVGLVAGQVAKSAFDMPASAGVDPDMMQAQEEMQAEVNAISRKYLPFSIVSVVMRLCAAIALLLGGILTLKVSATGRRILLAGCVVAVLYELVQSVLGVIVQAQVIPIMQKTIGQAMPPGGPAELPPVFSQAMAGIMVVGLVVGVLVSLVKIAFYIFSVIYLQKEHVVARFTA